MQDNMAPRWLRAFGIGSVIFGLLGAAFSWWVPLGMVLSITGLVFGFADFLETRRRSLDHRLSALGLLVSAAALTLCIVIAYLGLQTVTFGGLR
jgi:hypothetical protein